MKAQVETVRHEMNSSTGIWWIKFYSRTGSYLGYVVNGWIPSQKCWQTMEIKDFESGEVQRGAGF